MYELLQVVKQGKPQTQQEKNYAQYVKHVQHQKEVIKEQHEKNNQMVQPAVPVPGQEDGVVSDFQSWLIDTGKRIYKILGWGYQKSAKWLNWN